MGASLARAAQWTAVSEAGRGKLELSPLNEKLLKEIIDFVESFPDKHFEESDYVFKDAISWETSVSSGEFGEGFSVNGSTITSDEKDSKGSPLLEVNNRIIKVKTMRQAAKVLQIAKEKSINETRNCLEANTDPTMKILGPAFATVSSEDSTVIRLVDKNKNEENSENSVQLRFLLIMQQLDMKLMNLCISEISKQVRLTPEEANSEVDLLINFAGDESTTPLKEISFTSNHIFNNNCRALPWRQLHGDICYVSIKPHDNDRFCATATSYGWFINGGFDADAQEVNYQKKSEVYKNLITLLRSNSPKFAENIDKQEILRRVETDGEGEGDDEVLSSDGDDDPEIEKESEMQSEKYTTQNKQVSIKGRIKTQRKKKLEPSLKWKTIEESQKTAKSAPKKKVVTASPVATRRKSSVRVKAEPEEKDFSESSEDSDDEEDVVVERRQDSGSDLPSEYWQIQKLVKYLKGGNQTATIIALCSMRDFNLNQETCQLAIRDVGGLEVLINLLDTEENKCKIGALKILKEITKNLQIRISVADLGGLQTMVEILTTRNKDLKCLTAETIANVARFRRARRTVRQHGGIRKLVDLLNIPENSNDIHRDMEVARSGALALLSLSKSSKNKHEMRRAGAIPLIARLLKSDNESLLMPVVGTLQECASETSYRLAIRKQGMIPYLVKNLDSSTPELQMHCAAAIFKSGEEKATRDLVRHFSGLGPLVKLLAQSHDKPLLAAATGAIWKCAKSTENVLIFQELGTIEKLVALMVDQPEEVLVNVAGAISECCKIMANRETVRRSGGIPSMIKLLTGTNDALLVNCTNAVGLCATEVDNMTIIDRLDGVRLLWSLLKNPNPDVQASAAWAVCPCIENAKDSGEMVRSFVGGLELIVSLLKSDVLEVLASSCAAIANIAKDEENLAVITDHGVVPMLARLANTNKDRLRRRLAEAIAECCKWGNNRIAFGKEKAVAPLVGYLKSKDTNVHKATAQALFQLSRDPQNCITMHEAGVVKYLLKMVGSQDIVLQEASAGCISNIRRLAFANEKARYG